MAAGRDRLCGDRGCTLDDHHDPFCGGVMKKPEVEVVFEHSHAKYRMMRMTWNGVTFYVPNSFAMLFKLAEYAGMDESAFMDEMKPYY